MTDFEAYPSAEHLLVTFVVRPEEIELAFATEGDTLRQRLMLAIMAALTRLSLPRCEASTRLPPLVRAAHGWPS
jgi:hypothetical protein